MSNRLRMFWSPEIEARFNTAHEAVVRQWPVPYEELCISTRFGDTHVIASGAKALPPLVLLHPAGGGSTIWYRNVGPFSQNYRTYAVDVIGDMNRSVPTRFVRSRKDFADWIADLFDGLQIERAKMVGNSYGGLLTLSTASLLPDRADKIVLISPAATFVQIWSIYWHTIIPGYWLAPIIHSEPLVHWAANWIWQDFPIDDCVAELRAIAQVAGYPRYRPTHNPPPSVFGDEELRKIRTPTLLLIGDHEVLYDPPLVIGKAARLMTNLRAEVIPNANHVAQYTAADVVNKRVLDFFAN